MRLDLVVTGGSDFHGENAGHTAIGAGDVPESVLDALLARAGDRAHMLRTA
jgi:hypothetical protein